MNEGRTLQYTDSAAYTQLSRVIDIVDQSAHIVHSYFADRYNPAYVICLSYYFASTLLPQISQVIFLTSTGAIYFVRLFWGGLVAQWLGRWIHDRTVTSSTPGWSCVM